MGRNKRDQEVVALKKMRQSVSKQDRELQVNELDKRLNLAMEELTKERGFLNVSRRKK